MFEKLYKTVESKVQPSVELINETKLKMKAELDNKNKVVHINFYKYATIAACLIIFIGVLSVNTTKDLVMNESTSINETVNDSYKESADTNISINDSPFNAGAFDSAMSTGSAVSNIGPRNSILGNISDFFINIIQWFKELLF